MAGTGPGRGHAELYKLITGTLRQVPPAEQAAGLQVNSRDGRESGNYLETELKESWLIRNGSRLVSGQAANIQAAGSTSHDENFGPEKPSGDSTPADFASIARLGIVVFVYQPQMPVKSAS